MPLDNSVLIAIIGLGTPMIGAISAFGSLWLKQKYEEKKLEESNTFSNTIPAVHKVYSILNMLVKETGAERVLILKTENGGGRPKVGSPLKSSIIYEVFSGSLNSVRDLWQNQLLDEAYIEILCTMMMSENKTHTIKTEDMRDNSILKNSYKSADVVGAKLVEIVERPKEYLYLSINYPAGDFCEDPRTLDLQRFCITALRNVFSDYEDL